MWSYYGSKRNIAALYPAPLHARIIEPFAGSAQYAFLHWKKKVLLIDRYPAVVNMWKFLQTANDNEFDEIPVIVAPGQTIHDFAFTSEGAKMLFSWIIGTGVERPKVKVSGRMVTDRPTRLAFTVNRLRRDRIRVLHWDIVCDDYRNADNVKATWFIDPPYQEGGQSYVHRSVNYSEIARYSLSRKGQVIVCEKSSATWLQFQKLTVQQGTAGPQHEGMFYLPNNEGNAFRPSQLCLF